MDLLLIDIGNTHLKWAQEQAGEFHYGGQVKSTENDVNLLFKNVFSEMTPDRVILANVAKAALGEQIDKLTSAAWQIQAEEMISSNRACGVTNAYAKPATLGIDRWAAMVAAFAWAKSAVCVVDCGTALTIDVVDATGLHVGGLILPGYHLMQQAILQKGEKVQESFEADTTTGGIRFGQSTGSCVQQGSLLAARAVIEQAQVLAEEQLGSQPQIILTGGDTQTIQSRLSIEVHYEPCLVLQGLALLAQNAEAEKRA